MQRACWTAAAVLVVLTGVPTAVAAESDGGVPIGQPAALVPMAVAMLAFAGGLAPTIALRHPRSMQNAPNGQQRPGGQSRPLTASLGLMADGVGHLHAGQPQAAVPLLKQAARGRPKDPAARYAYGVSLVLAGRLQDGLEQISYAIRLDDVLLAVMVQDPFLVKAGVLRRREVHAYLQRMSRWYSGRIDPSYA